MRPVDLLHHRPPYLLIDDVVETSPDHAVTTYTIRGDEFFITGHFPGAPILPGAMMQEMSSQTGGILIASHHNPMAGDYDTHDPTHNPMALGVLVKVSGARYRGFARPGQTVTARVELRERVDDLFSMVGKLTADGNTILRNEFQLTNIPSDTLRGSERD